ncbi:hypothetical protein GCM10029992_51000 [Glycomyces albus]
MRRGPDLPHRRPRHGPEAVRVQRLDPGLPHGEPLRGRPDRTPAEAKAAGQNLWDQQQDIAYGRAELSSIPDMVETYLNNGGEAAREHYTDAYLAVHGE